MRTYPLKEMIRTRFAGVIVPILSMLAAFAVAAIPIFLAGANPINAYKWLLIGSFGSLSRITWTLRLATPIMLASLGAVVAFKCKVWNLGSEGQLQFGALCGTWMALTLAGIPLLLPIVMIGAFIAGAALAGIAGLLKLKFRVNEIISTVMMNTIVTLFIAYVIGSKGPMRDTSTLAPTSVPTSPTIPSSAWLPRLPVYQLHAGFLIALVCAPLVYILLTRTVFGYNIKAVGANPEAARCKGISISKTVMIAMVISGGLAGIAGMSEVSGVHNRLIYGFSENYGWTAIMTAMLGKLHPIGCVLASIMFAALICGADTMARMVEVPFYLSYVIQALVVLFVLMGPNLGRVRKFLSRSS